MPNRRASITTPEGTWFSELPEDQCTFHRSAVTELIEGICWTQPQYARALLRHPIQTVSPLNAFEDGMVRVLAKRLGTPQATLPEGAREVKSSPMRPDPRIPSPPARFDSLEAAKHWIITVQTDLALAAGKSLLEGEKRSRLDRPIVAIGLDSELSVWGAARARGTESRAWHAEAGLILSRLRAGHQIPPGWILTSLKPCRMCAGLLYELLKTTPLEILYSEFDPGPQARETILNASSPDRKRLAPEDTRELEHQFK